MSRKAKFCIFEVELPRRVIGYKIDRDMTKKLINVTLFWDDFYGFTGVAEDIEDAIADACRKRGEFFRTRKLQVAEPLRQLTASQAH